MLRQSSSPDPHPSASSRTGKYSTPENALLLRELVQQPNILPTMPSASALSSSTGADLYAGAARPSTQRTIRDSPASLSRYHDASLGVGTVPMRSLPSSSRPSSTTPVFYTSPQTDSEGPYSPVMDAAAAAAAVEEEEEANASVSDPPSVDSAALGSADYHSIGSPAVPTASVEDLVSAGSPPQAEQPPHGRPLRVAEWPAAVAPGVAESAPLPQSHVSPAWSRPPSTRPSLSSAAAASSVLMGSPPPSSQQQRGSPSAARTTAAQRYDAESLSASRRSSDAAVDGSRVTPFPAFLSDPRTRHGSGSRIPDEAANAFLLGGGSSSGGGPSCPAGSPGNSASAAAASGGGTRGGAVSGGHGVSAGRGNGGDDGEQDRTPLPERPLYFQPFKDAEEVCASATASAGDWVLLNVGGRLITTTVATLMADPDSMLASLCSCLTPAATALTTAAAVTHSLPSPLPSQSSAGAGAAAAAALPVRHPYPASGAEADAALNQSGGEQGANTNHGSHPHRYRRVAEYAAGEEAAAHSATTTAHLEDSHDASPHGHGGLSRAEVVGHDAAMMVGDGGPAGGDGDTSSRAADEHRTPSPHRSVTGAAPLQLSHPQQLPSSSSSAAPVSALRGPAGNERDGEVVNPQQPVSTVPLDADRYNAILLDLDADYFLPVLNYLRHGAVMIPRYISVDGVLAMAEYLNVAGLVRLLRGPPVPRRVLLFSWGSGSNGELGTHAVRDEPTPTMAQVTPFGVRVREVALGANYSCALTDKGHVYAFGNGEWGQLGLGSGLPGGRGGSGSGAGSMGGGGGSANGGNGNGGGVGPDGSGTDIPVELLIPRRIPLFERVPAVHVAAGYAFAMAVVEGHHVYFWGNNNHGQSGRGRSFFDPHTKRVDAPVLVETLEGKRIVQLSCGSFFALALSEDGALYSWGLVDCVGLGTPEEVERRYPTVLGESLSNERRSVVLTPQLVTVKGRRRGNAAHTAGATVSSSSSSPAGAAAGGQGAACVSERIVRIRAGQWHSGAINEHGELFTWGVGYQGRLGHGSKTPAYVPTLVRGALEGQRVVDVACGSFHTVALTSTGHVFCWGDNASGQCGTTANNPDAFTSPYRVIGLEYVAGGVARSIACGRQHTVVVMEGPQPWCMLPCCQVDAGGRPAHSHAQVYSFGETARAANGGAAGAAAAVSAGGAGRGQSVVMGPHGVPVSALAASTLPGSSGHGSFFLPPHLGGTNAHVAGLGTLGVRQGLAATAGHHHPHYQLVTGLQGADVRAVVSGLHHTFAYVEDLMAEDTADGADRESQMAYAHGRGTEAPLTARRRHLNSAAAGGSGGSAAVGSAYTPVYPPPHHQQAFPSAARRSGEAWQDGRGGASVMHAWPRGGPTNAMAFQPPGWGASGQRGPPAPAHLPAAVLAQRSAASSALPYVRERP